MKQRRWMVISLLVLTLVVLLARSQEVARIRGHHAAAYGRFTEAQILAHAEPLCRRLWPQVNTCILTADPLPWAVAPHTKAAGYWQIHATDRNGRTLAQFCWDAETGELLYILVNRPMCLPNPPAARLSQAQLVSLCREWLVDREPGPTPEHYRLSRTRSSRGGLLTCWQSERHRAYVEVENGGGLLRHLCIWRRSA